MIVYDMHCHLDLFPNMIQLIDQITDYEISILAVGTTPKAFKQEIDFCKKQPKIHVAVGLHPQLVLERFSEIRMLEELIYQTKFVGEVGLDYSKKFVESKENQITVFSKVIGLCSRYGNKVLSIHAVKSLQDVLSICEQNNLLHNNIAILHWYTGTVSQLRKAVEMGFYFSVNSKMLNTKSGQNIISEIPDNRILIESDAPFIKQIEDIKMLKSELELVIQGISCIKGRDMQNVIFENSRHIVESFE